MTRRNARRQAGGPLPAAGGRPVGRGAEHRRRPYGGSGVGNGGFVAAVAEARVAQAIGLSTPTPPPRRAVAETALLLAAMSPRRQESMMKNGLLRSISSQLRVDVPSPVTWLPPTGKNVCSI